MKSRMKKEYTAFNRNLKLYREKAGYTATEFSSMIGISRNTYLPYETQNREPSFAVLLKIAQTLHISTDELLGNEQTELQKALAFCQHAGYTVIPKEKMNEFGQSFLPKGEKIAAKDEVFFIDSGAYSDWLKSPLTTVGTEKIEHDGESVEVGVSAIDIVRRIRTSELLAIVKEIQNSSVIEQGYRELLDKKFRELENCKVLRASVRNLSKLMRIPVPEDLSKMTLKELEELNKILNYDVEKLLASLSDDEIIKRLHSNEE